MGISRSSVRLTSEDNTTWGCSRANLPQSLNQPPAGSRRPSLRQISRGEVHRTGDRPIRSQTKHMGSVCRREPSVNRVASTTM